MTFSTVKVRSSRDRPGITSARKVTFISGLAQILAGVRAELPFFLNIDIFFVAAFMFYRASRWTSYIVGFSFAHPSGRRRRRFSDLVE
jgi:hypothetical protein